MAGSTSHSLLRLPLELIMGGGSCRGMSLVFEFIHTHCWQGGSVVVRRVQVMSLMNRNSGVHDRRLNSFLLNNRLHNLMYVVVTMFSSDGGVGGLCVLSLVLSSFVLYSKDLSFHFDRSVRDRLYRGEFTWN